MLCRFVWLTTICCLLVNPIARANDEDADHAHAGHVQFTMQSIRDGDWTDPNTWQPAEVPAAGDRVLISRGTHVRYDAASDDVIRLVQIIGTLQFARDRNTLLNVGVLKVQNSDECSESGFACDFHGTNKTGEPQGIPDGPLPTLEVGTTNEPIPAEFTARIRTPRSCCRCLRCRGDTGGSDGQRQGADARSRGPAPAHQ